MTVDLHHLGLTNLKRIYYNLPTSRLYEEIIQRDEGTLAKDGPIVVNTGQYTGRSPDDKFIVEEDQSSDHIWWGKVNKPFAEADYDALLGRVQAYLQGRDLFVQDCHAGADPAYRISLRVITQYAWHSLFARNMLLPASEGFSDGAADWHLLYAPDFHANPKRDGTGSEVFIQIHFARRLILIGGSRYAGELKKAVFTILNYILPRQDILSMHCSANTDSSDQTALFFGLSGTGKTTLSASPDRILIGDDEHGWSPEGVFNFEGGCYAKAINLNSKAEPEIYATTRRFGTVLENVAIDPDSRTIDLDDDRLTENTRASYPIDFIPNTSPTGTGGHPRNLIMLTCDAFGVLPPVCRLNTEEAMYHFISGYTAKVAGTERGVTEPTATFSPCFGAPFMVLHPTVYARQLGEKIRRHQTQCWLVNTGWSGGPYGQGQRISIAYSRAIITAILNGQLNDQPFRTDPIFGLAVPEQCPGVPETILTPRITWSDPQAYDDKAGELANLFIQHFAEYAELAPDLQSAGPRLI
ncbi:MAG: phosphoenolpyruvate carboxykinase (ATP) [Candidatus Latescibacteria bacterium]|nr:phosphoenolpyruvate carboxykinase (ATP) [Candidatus Latescibacterota bacterium]